MSNPARRDDEDARKLALAPEYGPRAYLHREDGSWAFVGDDGWPVDPDEYAELHADAMAVAKYTPIAVDLLTAVCDGLLSTIGVEPISVEDVDL